MKLTDMKCKQTKPTGKPQKLSDGGGLFLLINPNGGKYWKMKYRFMGKEKQLSFGVYPRTSLSEARQKREDAKKLIENGEDPAEIKKLQKLQRENEYKNSFESLTREWHGQRVHCWQPKHGANILKRMEVNIFPHIGSRPITMVTAPEILYAIRKVEDQGKLDLAHRLMQTCGQVFTYAIASGRAERNPVPDLKGALKPVISKRMAHLKEDELPEFLEELEIYDSKHNGTTVTKLAFKFLIMTFVRSGEIRGAKWDEIDWEKKQWRIPADRMKMKETHIVPLAEQSIALLKQLQQITGDSYSGYIFPSKQSPRRCMSENTFLRAIEIMGYKGRVVGHGFRSTASTILNENGFRPDVIERQLAHCERNQVRAAYNHAQYLPERTKMMQWWADYLDGCKDGAKAKS